MAPIALDGPRHAPKSGRAAKQLVVLLHGLGSDGEDIDMLAPLLAPALPQAAFVAPTAPFFQRGSPEARQWFEVGDIPVAQLHAGIEAAVSLLDAFVDAERTRLKLRARDVALVGFSQGAMMALWSGLRRDPGPGAILAYSGALVGDTRLPAELRWKPPVLLVHGTEDQVINPRYTEGSERKLKEMAVPVRALYRRGLGHSLDTESIAAGAAFLADWADGKLPDAAPHAITVN